MSRTQIAVFAFAIYSLTSFAHAQRDLRVIKAGAKDKYQRTQIVNLGIPIDGVGSDGVTIFGTEEEAKQIKALGIPVEILNIADDTRPFPTKDAAYHDYSEVLTELDKIATDHPDIAQRFSMGKSLEGRELNGIRLSTNTTKDSLPTAIFLGCHHAREHLSVEVPLMLAKHLAENFDRDARIRELLTQTEVWIVPMVNPDGAEYDISTGSYKMWRKNRRKNSDGSYGVDLNRNYGPSTFFGGPGSSSATFSDIYRGPHEFSEPETAAVRDFVTARTKATTLLTFHTFSELVMWPYGHTDDEIANDTDRQVFETMGKKMAEWNHYTPQKSSELYLASGDTTDWAYETKKIFAFTFELSPSSMGAGGFYPGAAAIQPTFEANLEPALYLIEQTPNPYTVLDRN